MATSSESRPAHDAEPSRRGIGHATLIVLAAASAAALLIPSNPQGPFDARTWEPASDVELSYSRTGALLEPLIAGAHLISGAPDYLSAAISISVWIAVLGFVAPFATGLLRSHTSAPLAALHALGVSAGLLLLFLVYLGIAALSHLPGWRLDATDPDVVLVDLQSHTLWSHDGIAPVARNLAWHRECGFDAVAVTDHNTLLGAKAALKLTREPDELPAVIEGMEVWRKGFLVMLGSGGQYWTPPEAIPQAIEQAHERGMAVVSLPWKADAEGVKSAAAAGVDGFEIVNQGHPFLPNEVREAILAEAGPSRIALVASTDWHGWSGHCRAWTAVKMPGWRTLSREQLSGSLVGALRKRRVDAFQPVAAGYMGPTSMLRVIFTPIVETLRYLAELTPARIAGWWIWALAFVWIHKRVSRTCLRPKTVLSAALGALLSCGLLILSIRLLAAHAVIGTASTLAPSIAQQGIILAVIGIAVASLVVWRGMAAARRQPNPETPTT